MTLSLLPVMSVSAMTTNRVTRQVGGAHDRAVLYEEGMGAPDGHNQGLSGVASNTGYGEGRDPGRAKPEWFSNGTSLILELNWNSIRAGDQINLTLENAEWFFRQTAVHNVPANTNNRISTSSQAFAGVVDRASRSTTRDGDYRREPGRISAHTIPVAPNFSPTTTFNVNRGALVTHPNRETVTLTGAHQTGAIVYERFQGQIVGRDGREIPYQLEVSSWNRREAILTIMPERYDTQDAISDGYGTYTSDRNRPLFIVVPLVIRLDGTGDARVTVSDFQATGIGTQTTLFATAGGRATTTTVTNPQTARDDFVIPELVIRELRANSLQNGYFTIAAPAGFEFKGINGRPIPFVERDRPREINVFLEGGLHWTGRSPDGNRLVNVIDSDGRVIAGSTSFVEMFFRELRNGEFDYSTLFIRTVGITRSVNLPGTMYITGLGFTAEDNERYGDVEFTINRFRGTVRAPGNDIRTGDDPLGVPHAYVTEQTFLAGIRRPWDIMLETLDEIPELINGRWEDPNPEFARNEEHRTSRVRFSEQSVNAWWAGRDTTFTLPEGVVFRKVRIYPTSYIERYGDLRGFYFNNTQDAGRRVRHVTISGNTLTLNNLEVRADRRSSLTLDMWVSIRSGFEGDITLAVSGRGVPDYENIPPVVIATAISPVTVETRVTDVRIGYQDQMTADIIITENRAGALQRGKWVAISLTDLANIDDMTFSPRVAESVEVTDGNLRINNISVGQANAGFWYGTRTTTGPAYTFGDRGLGVAQGSITFNVERASAEPSTIVISDVSVRLDRTVPFSNDRPYQIVVWGEAIAPNFGPNPDQFPVRYAGIFADYLMVVTPPTAEQGVLNNEVWVTIGENFFIRNGVPEDMPVAAYISPASNSTMVPLRFISNALGVPYHNVIWSDSARTVTISVPGRTIQFTIGSDIFLDNGIPRNMVSPDGLPVAAEIRDDRSFVPFRALGEAFGIPVSWCFDTNTAKYNEGLYAGLR
jgi:hypothetical protein